MQLFINHLRRGNFINLAVFYPDIVVKIAYFGNMLTVRLADSLENF